MDNAKSRREVLEITLLERVNLSDPLIQSLVARSQVSQNYVSRRQTLKDVHSASPHGITRACGKDSVGTAQAGVHMREQAVQVHSLFSP